MCAAWFGVLSWTVNSAPVHVTEQQATTRARWRLRPSSEVATAFVVALAIVFRMWLIAKGMPRFDSDEGTVGLMALHIEHGTDHPVFFYGQAYMGSLEAYLAAILFRLFGASDFTLRLGLVALYGVFLGAMYLLMRLLHGKRIALAGVVLLGLGSREILSRQLKAVGGYPEMLVFAALVFLMACTISISVPSRHRQMLLYGGWGLAAGLGLWSDPLILPFVAMSGLLLVLHSRQELRGLGGAFLALGLLAGASPLIAYNLSVPIDHGTVSSIVSIARAGGSGHVARSNTGGPSPGSAGLAERLEGLLAVSIPVITGGNGFCPLLPQDAWPLTRPSTARTKRCSAIHEAWGIGFVALWVLAVAVVLAALGGAHRHDRDVVSASDRRTVARYRGRLALLGAAGLTIVLFLLSSAPAVAPWFNVRYLEDIWVALPEIVALPVSVAFRRRGRFPSLVRTGAVILLVVPAVALLRDTASAANDGGYTSWLDQQQRTLAAMLLHRHIHRIYSDYWTCDWLAFETREQIVCATLDTHLRPSLDRYLPYRRTLQQDHRPVYVFQADAPQTTVLDTRMRRCHACFQRTALPLFVIYRSGDGGLHRKRLSLRPAP